MTDQTLQAIAAGLAARNAAQARLDAAAAALERGRQMAEAATSCAGALTDEDDRRSAEFSRRLEQAALTAEPAVPYFEIDAPAAAERHRAELETRAANQAVERLTAAHSAAAEALRSADGKLIAIRRQEIANRVDKLTVELLELRSRELEIVGLISALGHNELGGVPLSAQAMSAVSYPPTRPTANTLISAGAVADVDSPLCGRFEVLERAHAYWRDFVAQLEERAAKVREPVRQEAA
jgi:NADH dehydrogenase/NADH:ubiquinone oxidoreductase subunit G